MYQTNDDDCSQFYSFTRRNGTLTSLIVSSATEERNERNILLIEGARTVETSIAANNNLPLVFMLLDASICYM